jgi:hypothetical protein
MSSSRRRSVLAVILAVVTVGTSAAAWADDGGNAQRPYLALGDSVVFGAAPEVARSESRPAASEGANVHSTRARVRARPQASGESGTEVRDRQRGEAKSSSADVSRTRARRPDGLRRVRGHATALPQV